jgi:hypothetical protein
MGAWSRQLHLPRISAIQSRSKPALNEGSRGDRSAPDRARTSRRRERDIHDGFRLLSPRTRGRTSQHAGACQDVALPEGCLRYYCCDIASAASTVRLLISSF